MTLQQGQHALYRLQTREIGAVIVRPVTRDLHHDRHAADPLLPGGRHHHLRHPYRGERVQQAGGHLEFCNFDIDNCGDEYTR